MVQATKLILTISAALLLSALTVNSAPPQSSLQQSFDPPGNNQMCSALLIF